MAVRALNGGRTLSRTTVPVWLPASRRASPQPPPRGPLPTATGLLGPLPLPADGSRTRQLPRPEPCSRQGPAPHRGRGGMRCSGR